MTPLGHRDVLVHMEPSGQSNVQRPGKHPFMQVAPGSQVIVQGPAWQPVEHVEPALQSNVQDAAAQPNEQNAPDPHVKLHGMPAVHSLLVEQSLPGSQLTVQSPSVHDIPHPFDPGVQSRLHGPTVHFGWHVLPLSAINEHGPCVHVGKHVVPAAHVQEPSVVAGAGAHRVAASVETTTRAASWSGALSDDASPPVVAESFPEAAPSDVEEPSVDRPPSSSPWVASLCPPSPPGVAATAPQAANAQAVSARANGKRLRATRDIRSAFHGSPSRDGCHPIDPAGAQYPFRGGVEG
jgi:hypothetical protein